MPSTYTVNLGIEKPATGEQSGTWGDTTNVNFDILDQAINGAERVTLTSAGSSGSPNSLQITNGATSDGRNKWLEFYSSSDLGGSAFVQLDPNDAEKIVFVRNSLAGSQSVILFQGTYNAARDLEVPAGVDMVVKFDGGGASAATVTDVFTKLRATEITTPTLTATTADINGGTIDNSVIGGSTAAAVTGTTVVANTSLNIAGDGATVTGIKDEDDMSSNSPTKLATQQSIKAYVDSQVGTVDTWAEVLANGATSGSTNPEVTAGQALKTNTINETSAGSGVTIDSVLLKDDVVNATDIETGSISANDGTASATIANSTGVMTIASSVLTTTDINGGSIDGANIGASSAGTGAFTSLTSSNSLVITSSVPRVTLNDSDGTNTIGDIRQVSDATVIKSRNGSSNGSVKFNGDNGTTETEYGRFDSNGVFTSRLGAVFNEDSADVDFRVESNSNTHALFVDAGNDRVDMAVPLRVGYNEITATANAGIGQFATATSGSGELWTDINTGVNGYSSMPSEISVMNTADNTTNTFAGIFFQAGETSAGAGVSAARIGAIRTAALSADLAFATRAAGTGTMAEHMRLTNDGKLGIGTVNIDEILHVEKASGTTLVKTEVAAGSVVGYEIQKTGATTANWQIADGVVANGQLEIYDVTNSRSILNADSSETVINDTSANLDFRVESDGNSHMLFVDASQNAVGINDSAPSGVRLTVLGVDTAALAWGDTVKRGFLSFDGGGAPIVRAATGLGLKFQSNGTRDVAVFGTSESVFNEPGNNQDFRVESDNNSNILFIDASADTVNIGNTTDFGGILNVNGGLNSKQAVFTSTNNRGLALSTASRSGQNDGVAIVDAQDTESTGGRLELHTMGAERARFERDQIVFNDSSNDQDFRVESDSNTHAIYMDAGTSTVGINSSSTTDTLTVFSSASDKGITIHNGSTSGFENPTLTFIDQGNSTSKLAVRGDAFCFDTYNAANTVQIVGVSGLFKANNASQLEGGVTINDNSADADFRVESNGNSAMLFVDAGNNRVGIGTSSPTETLHIAGTTVLQNAATTTLTLDATNDGSGSHVALIDVNTNSARGSHIALTDNSGVQFGIKRDYNSGSPITRAHIYTDNGTTEKPVMSFDYDGVTIFNEDSYDQDFRVESDSNTHALFVEASKKGIAINDDNTQASGFDTTIKLGGAASGGGLVAYVEEINVTNGSYIDVNIGNSSINYWTGMLGVNCSSMSNGSNRTQSLISILANNQFPGFNTSVLHTADGTSARSFTVTYVATGTIRITNTSGDTVGLSAWFTGGGTQF